MLRGILSALWGRSPGSSPLELLREKRRAPRRSNEQQLIVRSGSQTFPARCLDQSQGGLRFECAATDAVKCGDNLELSSTERALRLTGRVAWVKNVAGRRQVGVKREGGLEAQKERRQFVRVNAPLTAACAGQRLKILDLSLRGLRVETEQHLTGHVRLELHLPGPPLCLKATVLEARGNVLRLCIPTLEQAAQQRLGEFLAAALR